MRPLRDGDRKPLGRVAEVDAGPADQVPRGIDLVLVRHVLEAALSLVSAEMGVWSRTLLLKQQSCASDIRRATMSVADPDRRRIMSASRRRP